MAKTHAYILLMAVAPVKSAYFLSLSTNSKRWYEAKLSNAGLSVDPVCVCVCVDYSNVFVYFSDIYVMY